jgi:hypothetical protein
MRAAAPILLLALLAACSDGGKAQQTTRVDAPGPEKIWCALDGARDFAQDCTLERGRDGTSASFVIRHPDGGFRRLEASKDGQNLLAADGAELSQSALKQDRYEVILGDNRYVIPLNAPAP